jgi:hypothetical protein
VCGKPITDNEHVALWYYVEKRQSCLHFWQTAVKQDSNHGRPKIIIAKEAMDTNAALLDTLLQQAESAAQRHGQRSRLTRQAITRKLERTDSDTVAGELDDIYKYRVSRLPAAWRLAQQRTLYSKNAW